MASESIDEMEAKARSAIAEGEALIAEGKAALAGLAALKRLDERNQPAAVRAEPAPQSKAVQKLAKHPLTVMTAIRRYLETIERPWTTANQIQAGISEILNRKVPMSSVSPKLTELKNQGVIVRDDMKVALALRVTQSAKKEVQDDLIG